MDTTAFRAISLECRRGAGFCLCPFSDEFKGKVNSLLFTIHSQYRKVGGWLGLGEQGIKMQWGLLRTVAVFTQVGSTPKVI